MQKTSTGFGLIIILLSALAACSAPKKAIVYEHETINRKAESERIGGSHVRIVQSGDTIYGIAFQNGLDPIRVAAWNKISDTGALQIGQKVRLTPPVGFKYREPKPAKVVTVETVGKTSPKKTSLKKGAPKTTQTKKAPKTVTSTLPKVRSWIWPTKGNVIATFSPKKTQQGIDIKGKLGQPVIATAAGEVVYVGNGLKGYGNLAIIKHNNDFLSAYAHNQEVFVQEGQRVKARQRIATVGSKRTEQGILHFQIRYHGEPVNPLKYLPNR